MCGNYINIDIKYKATLWIGFNGLTIGSIGEFYEQGVDKFQ
jgi:hypothetical protein